VDHAAAPARVRKGLARHPIPVMVLARLAVDIRHQGRSVGVCLEMPFCERFRPPKSPVSVRFLSKPRTIGRVIFINALASSLLHPSPATHAPDQGLSKSDESVKSDYRRRRSGFFLLPSSIFHLPSSIICCCLSIFVGPSRMAGLRLPSDPTSRWTPLPSS
jgi:hypothetical protein